MWAISESENRSVVSDSLRSHELYSPLNSSGQNIGMGSVSLLQGIFPTQELNWGLLQVLIKNKWLYRMRNQKTVSEMVDTSPCLYDDGNNPVSRKNSEDTEG